MDCSICGNKIYTMYGNNAEPINSGTCCDMCNQTIVIPARIKQINEIYTMYKEREDSDE